MKVLNKTALAISLSLIGAISSMSAIAMSKAERRIEQKIEIVADDTKDVQVFVSNNGNITELEVPQASLTDKAYLENALADLPSDLREKLVAQLSNIHMDGKVIKLNTADANTWVEGDGEKVIVLKSIGEGDAHTIAKEMVQQFTVGDGKHKVFEFKHGKKATANTVMRLLEHGSFTPEELDKIQQALDAKR